MSGYKRDIVMRIVAVNGGESVYWFNDRLTDLGMHIRCTPSYPRSMTIDEDLNRVLRPIVYAKRANVTIEVLIVSMADQWFLQEIEEALDDPENYAVFLSLDGGVVEREVVWMDAGGLAPQPFAGKTCVGATFVLSLQTKAPIGPRGPMMTDPGIGAELVQDGGVEGWSGGQPINWTHTVAATATVSQETSILRSAGSASAARVTRTAAGTPPDGTSFFAFAPLLVGMQGLKRNAWYRYRGSVYGVGFTNPGMRVQIFNSTKQIGVAPDGKTWGGASQDLIAAGTILSNAWADFEAYFRVPVDAASFADADLMLPRMAGYFGASNAVIYDDISVYGPVLRPGYATW